MTLIAQDGAAAIFETNCPVYCDYVTCQPGLWDFGTTNLIGEFVENANGIRLTSTGAGFQANTAINAAACGGSLEVNGLQFIFTSDEPIIDHQKDWCLELNFLSGSEQISVYTNKFAEVFPPPLIPDPGICYGGSVLSADTPPVPSINFPFDFTEVGCRYLAKSICDDCNGYFPNHYRMWSSWDINNLFDCCVSLSASVDTCNHLTCCSFQLESNFSINTTTRGIIEGALIGGPDLTAADFGLNPVEGCYLVWEDIYGAINAQRYYVTSGISQEWDGTNLIIRDADNRFITRDFSGDAGYVLCEWPGFIQGWNHEEKLNVSIRDFSVIKSLEYTKGYCCPSTFPQ